MDIRIFYRIFNGLNIMIKYQKLYNKNSNRTYRSYIIGFLLSVIITISAFYIAVCKIFSAVNSYIMVYILAITQLYVQLVFFMHLSERSKTYWNIISFIFTLVIIIILVSGTLWITYNLYTNMMLVTI